MERIRLFMVEGCAQTYLRSVAVVIQSIGCVWVVQATKIQNVKLQYESTSEVHREESSHLMRGFSPPKEGKSPQQGGGRQSIWKMQYLW